MKIYQKETLIQDEIIEWDSSQENNPDFLIKYYKGRKAYWLGQPEHIGRKTISNFEKEIKRLSKQMNKK
jgi:hypothetical protein